MRMLKLSFKNMKPFHKVYKQPLPLPIIMTSEKNRKTIIGIGIIISFALLILSASMYFSYQHEERTSNRLTPTMLDELSKEELKSFIEERREEQITIHSYYFLPFAAFLGVLVGTLVYYVMSDKVIQQEQALTKNTKIILNFLSPEERKVITTLLENNGKVQQYELSHLPNLNKVKTHRILANLEAKGIIHKERLGKINKIILNKELYDVLKE